MRYSSSGPSRLFTTSLFERERLYGVPGDSEDEAAVTRGVGTRNKSEITSK